MKRGWLVFFLTALTCAAFAQNKIDSPAPTFDPKPWLDDFHQIVSEMSSHYANLEWAIEDRRMDLPRLRQETEAKLRDATDERDARRIIDQFLAAFGDGHLELQWPKPSPSAKPATRPLPGLCERMGYNMRLHPGLDFSGLPEFSALNTPDSKFFPAGILRLRSHKVIGILRIAVFSEHAFPDLCEQAVDNLHLSQDTDCDEKCDDLLELATANLLTPALARQANALAAAGATTLLIDITHNGGGSDWVEASTRALSPVPLDDSKFGFIKHEHWTRQLQDRLRDVQADINHHAAPGDLLNEAASKLQKAIDASRQPCDRTDVWDTGLLRCSLLVKDFLFTSGILAYAKPGSFASLQSRGVLFSPGNYIYVENPRALPLYVAVDRDTWSAAEYFAALLQDNHAALVIGEPTGGAGCGYTNGGIPTQLKNSGAKLKMPDCVRFRPDGSNEENGITPDVLLPWAAHDSTFQRVRKLLPALERQPAQPAKLLAQQHP
jgi:hypothetical protein